MGDRLDELESFLVTLDLDGNLDGDHLVVGIWIWMEIWMSTLGVVGNQVNVATTHSGVVCGMGRKGH